MFLDLGSGLPSAENVHAAQWRTDVESDDVTPWGRLIGAVLAVKP